MLGLIIVSFACGQGILCRELRPACGIGTKDGWKWLWHKVMSLVGMSDNDGPSRVRMRRSSIRAVLSSANERDIVCGPLEG